MTHDTFMVHGQKFGNQNNLKFFRKKKKKVPKQGVENQIWSLIICPMKENLCSNEQ